MRCMRSRVLAPVAAVSVFAVWRRSWLRSVRTSSYDPPRARARRRGSSATSDATRSALSRARRRSLLAVRGPRGLRSCPCRGKAHHRTPDATDALSASIRGALTVPPNESLGHLRVRLSLRPRTCGQVTDWYAERLRLAATRIGCRDAGRAARAGRLTRVARAANALRSDRDPSVHVPRCS